MKWLLPLLLITACTTPEKKAPPPPTEEIEAVGTWEVTTPSGQRATILLEVDGTGTRRTGSSKQNGAWEQMGEQIWIFWDNGWIDRITLDKDQTIAESFGPGTALDAEPDHSGSARKAR